MEWNNLYLHQGSFPVTAQHKEMVTLVHTISHRIVRYLEKGALVVRDMDNTYLNLPVDDEASLLQLQGVHPD